MPAIWTYGTESCNNSPKCVKCKENHLTKDCKKSKDEKPYCANCHGEHRASSKLCPTYQERLKTIAEKREIRKSGATRVKEQAPPTASLQHYPNLQPPRNTQTPKANFWQQNQSTNNEKPVCETQEGIFSQIHEFQELLNEIKILNELCNITNLLNTVRLLNSKLSKSHGPIEQIQILTEILNDGAQGAHN